ncbi:hypothetical protein [Leuconostoc mesenteroides]|uniref:hypothetical protein n=1 Tax=Leuconostoc mesenteroides TaxID=1245 RepID=UPI002361DBEA|nr:hypothetical protein [Leuconostoc mesenteroides]
MKTVYSVDNNKSLQINQVDDSYVLKDGETFNEPQTPLYEPLSFVHGNIFGISKEEWQKNVAPSNGNNQGSETDAKIVQLTKTVLSQSAILKKQGEDIEKLMSQNQVSGGTSHV